MYNIELNRKREGLERDEEGRRTGFKCVIKLRRPMHPDSWLRWGLKQRSHISKHKTVKVTYASTKGVGFPNGIPITEMKSNKKMMTWLINHFYLTPGETYFLHGYTAGKTKTHVKFTKELCMIEIHNTEPITFTVSHDHRLRRYWFRQKNKEQKDEEET